jgi:antitoxin (DNA-binding transcriptional repressor) of toxin-antitoxin stability system
MNYMPVSELKRMSLVREKLEKEKEIILTTDGRPFAILVGVTQDTVEESLAEIRRALFSSAVLGIRKRAAGRSLANAAIEREITASRGARTVQ